MTLPANAVRLDDYDDNEAGRVGKGAEDAQGAAEPVDWREERLRDWGQKYFVEHGCSDPHALPCHWEGVPEDEDECVRELVRMSERTGDPEAYLSLRGVSVTTVPPARPGGKTCRYASFEPTYLFFYGLLREPDVLRTRADLGYMSRATSSTVAQPAAQPASEVESSSSEDGPPPPSTNGPRG